MNSGVVVRELDPTEYELWDELVETSPYGTIFHTIDWLTICRDSFNLDLNIYGCFHNEELVGGCSLFAHKFKRIFNVASSTCNMTPYGGILVKRSTRKRLRNQEELQNNVLKNVLKHIKEQGFDRVSITNSTDFIDIRQFSPESWIKEINYAYYFDLSEDIEAKMPKNMKTIIRKAGQNEIKIKKESNPQCFYDLFKETYERQQLAPPAQIEFFEKILDFLHENHKGEMWIAEMPTGEVAAAEIVIWDDKRAHRWSSASNADLKSHNSTSLLLYDIFQDLKSRNFKQINLMAANTPKITKFITAFNPKLVPYYTVTSYSTKFDICRQIINLIR